MDHSHTISSFVKTHIHVKSTISQTNESSEEETVSKNSESSVCPSMSAPNASMRIPSNPTPESPFFRSLRRRRQRDELKTSGTNGENERLSLEDKLANSMDRRKRIESRFQRERVKRRSSEKDRDQLLNFVKTLYNEMEDHPWKTNDESSSSSSFENNSSCETSHVDLKNSIAEFLTTYEDEHKNHGSSSLSSHAKTLLEKHDKQMEAVPSKESCAMYDSGSEEETDDFLELPVRFKSLEELAEEENKDGSLPPALSNPFRERDLHHAKELELHAQELADLHKYIDEKNEEHQRSILNLEHRFAKESQKREELLERALNYAEDLEAKERQHAQELQTNEERTNELIKMYEAKLLDLRENHTEAIRLEREKILKDSARWHADKVKALEEKHSADLANERELVTKKFGARQKRQEERQKQEYEARMNQRIQTHQKELDSVRAQCAKDLDAAALAHSEQLDVFKTSYEQKISSNEEKLSMTRAETERLTQELESARNSLEERDAIIEELRRTLRQQDENEEERVVCIAELDVDDTLRQSITEQMAKADASMPAKMVSELQELIQDRDSEIAEIEADLDRAMCKCRTQQRELEACAKREGLLEQRIVDLEKDLDAEKELFGEQIRKIQIEQEKEVHRLQHQLEENQERHTEDMAVMVSKMNALHTKLEDRKELDHSLANSSQWTPSLHEREDDSMHIHARTVKTNDNSCKQFSFLQEAMKTKKKTPFASSWFKTSGSKRVTMSGSIASDEFGPTSSTPDTSVRSNDISTEGDSDPDDDDISVRDVARSRSFPGVYIPDSIRSE